MKTLEIDIVSRAGAEFRGWGTRELYTAFTGRPPVYATRSRAWCMQTCWVPDFAVFAESKGYSVTLADRRVVDTEVAAPPRPEPDRGDGGEPAITEPGGLW